MIINNMNEQPTLQPIQQKPNKNRKWLKITAIVLVSILAVAAIGYSIYVWQQNIRLQNDIARQDDDIKKLSEENGSLRKSPDITSEQSEIEPTDLQLAQEAAQLYVDAQVLDEKYVAKITEVEGSFASGAIASQAHPEHFVMGMLLKKVDDFWVVIHQGQNGPDEATVTRFAVPEHFRR